MTSIRKLWIALGLLILCGSHKLPLRSATDRFQLSENYTRLPMSFELNQGQSDSSVKFLSRGQGYSLFLTSTEAVLALSKSQERRNSASVLRMQLLGGSVQAQVSGEDEQPGKSNYFVGDDPKQWHTNVPTFSKVRYSEVYSGIDLVYDGSGRHLEYDFVVEPGADPSAIRLGFGGNSQATLNSEGALALETQTGDEVRLHKPVAYQLVSGTRKEVDAEYVLTDAHEVTFRVGDYAVDEPLVIDPILSYSTYLGGINGDEAYGIAVDGSGNAYVTGFTQSANFPTANPFQPAYGGGYYDVYVSKLNAAGSALLYSTHLGGQHW